MDLDIARVIRSIPKEPVTEELTSLMTPWGEELAADPDAVPLLEHPRPQFARERVRMLHGWWEYAFVGAPNAATAWRDAQPPEHMDGRIRVPFSPEAVLSRVGRQLQPDELLWYRLSFDTPELAQGERCLLHFDGVDHACAVYLNGRVVARHEGAYEPFERDVTDKLVRGPAQLLELCVYDPSDTGTQLRGKQRLTRGGMWYTAQSGIWQPVWLEVVPAVCLNDLQIIANPDAGELSLFMGWSGKATLQVELLDAEGELVVQGSAEPELSSSSDVVLPLALTLSVPEPRLWTPENPYLYGLRLRYGADSVESYVAFRSFGVEPDAQGVLRLCLNHEPFFCKGLLDQGYWPDGLLTPPSDEAMVADLRAVRELGFNMVRKHIKVESERWYWHADRLGVLVWQDMPSGGENPPDLYARDLPTLFRSVWHRLRDDRLRDWKRLGAGDARYRETWKASVASTIARLSNHPCVVTWVLFNESWGQFASDKAVALARGSADPSHVIIAASGWYDQGAGDVHAVHNYFRTMRLFPDPYVRKGVKRAQVVSEFGGLVWHVEGHSSLTHSYGYAQFESEEAWREGLRMLLASADALEGEGLSGYVYTQLSDVEEETNGLLTYDRRVNKLA